MQRNLSLLLPLILLAVPAARAGNLYVASQESESVLEFAASNGGG